MQKQGGIFQKWFKEFTTAVFSQSLHAIILGVMLLVVQKVQSEAIFSYKTTTGAELFAGDQSQQDIIVAVIAFIAVSSITRFERIVKEIFGISTSQYLGDTKQSNAKMIMGAKSAISMGMGVAGAVSNRRELGSKLLKSGGKLGKMVEKGDVKFGKKGMAVATPNKELNKKADALFTSARDSMNGNSEQNINPDSAAGVVASATTSDIMKKTMSDLQKTSERNLAKAVQAEGYASKATDPLKKEMWDARSKEFMDRAKANQDAHNALAKRLKSTPIVAEGGSVATGSTSKSSEPLDARAKRRQEYEDMKYEEQVEKRNAKIESAVEEYNETKKQYDAANRKMIMQVASSVAGISVGAGSFDEMSEIMTAGNLISKPFTSAHSTIENRIGNTKIQSDTASIAKEVAESYSKDMKSALDSQFKNIDPIKMSELKLQVDSDAKEIIQNFSVSPKFINNPKNMTKAVKDMQNNLKELQNEKNKIDVQTDVAVKYNITTTSDVQEQVNKAKQTSSRELDSLAILNQSSGGKMTRALEKRFGANVAGFRYDGKITDISNI